MSLPSTTISSATITAGATGRSSSKYSKYSSVKYSALGLEMVSISNSYLWPSLGTISLKCFHGFPLGSFIKNLTFSMFFSFLAQMFHELVSRDREDGRATWQPYRGIGSEAYLNGTSQGRHPRTPGFRLGEPTARREGRPYPRSQQVIHETSGLGTSISYNCHMFYKLRRWQKIYHTQITPFPAFFVQKHHRWYSSDNQPCGSGQP
jgi:hypothetical protein